MTYHGVCSSFRDRSLKSGRVCVNPAVLHSRRNAEVHRKRNIREGLSKSTGSIGESLDSVVQDDGVTRNGAEIGLTAKRSVSSSKKRGVGREEDGAGKGDSLGIAGKELTSI